MQGTKGYALSGRWRPRLIMLDVDGTLLNSCRQITGKTRAALAQIQDNGTVVGLCSGRYYPGTRAIAREAKVFGPIVAGNGAHVISAEGETLFERPLPFLSCLALAELAKRESLKYNVYTNDTIISASENGVIAYYQALNSRLPQAERCPLVIAEDVCALIMENRERLLKIEILHIDDSARPKLLSCLAALHDIAFEGNLRGSVEAHAAGVDKGTGLLQAASAYRIAKADTMAFGNAENDLSMLRAAAVGVAMGNAPEAILAAADLVTADCDHDGIAEVLAPYLMKEG